MFNLFYKNSLLQGNLAAVLIITMIFLAGAWVLFYPKPVEALTFVDLVAYAQRAYNAVKDAAKWAWERVQAAYAYAADNIKTAIALWQKSDTLLARVTRVAATIAIHTLMNMLTNEIILWIQGGGEPKFISDWEGFLGDAGNKAGGLFVDKYLGAGWLCEPFDIAIKIPLLGVSTFDERVKCTLEDMGINIKMFYDDFKEAGWMGWIELTKPQGNFYGGYLVAQTEKKIQEEKAKEAAGQEGMAGSGFLSVKVCIRGKVVDNYTQEVNSVCNDIGSCKSAKESVEGDMDYSFICEEEKVQTPASVLSDVTSRAMDREMDILGQEVATMTANLGTFAPYVVAIGNALINRLIQEGLEKIQITGPTVENPDEPLPAGSPIADIESPAEAMIAADMAAFLVDQQEFLKENLETQLLPQQQSNLSVMTSIETIQSNILTTLETIFAVDCSLPLWANSQMTSTYTEPAQAIDESERTIEIFQITASNIGSISIKKSSWQKWSSCAYEHEGYCTPGYVTYHLHEILEISPQITSQITGLGENISSTNQRITDTATAIASTNDFIEKVDEYVTLFDETLQPPTDEEQAALDTERDAVQIALELLISDGQAAAQSSSEDMSGLSNDTQEANMTVNQTVDNLLQARGFSEEYPEAGTLYVQKQSLQVSLSEAQNIYSICTTPGNEEKEGTQ